MWKHLWVRILANFKGLKNKYAKAYFYFVVLFSSNSVSCIKELSAELSKADTKIKIKSVSVPLNVTSVIKHFLLRIPFHERPFENMAH